MSNIEHSHDTWRMYRIVKHDIPVKLEANWGVRKDVEFIQFICLMDGEICREIEIKLKAE